MLLPIQVLIQVRYGSFSDGCSINAFPGYRQLQVVGPGMIEIEDLSFREWELGMFRASCLASQRELDDDKPHFCACHWRLGKVGAFTALRCRVEAENFDLQCS